MAIEFNDAVAARHQTHDAAESRRLPDTVTAEQGGTLAFLHLQADALQDVQLADVDVNVAQAKNGRPPRRNLRLLAVPGRPREPARLRKSAWHCRRRGWRLAP